MKFIFLLTEKNFYNYLFNVVDIIFIFYYINDYLIGKINWMLKPGIEIVYEI